ncbi:hypothetical protein KQI68_01110 [Peptoniphilus sp. MSJ-1]|uniref:CRISPR-associated protein Cas8a1/Csx8, subtype I n=1 Tax=Peptoniphilus ovalis TaxID=2841503 RepID=A0ABS6FGT7_9FIRM|nr:hypothetical protein [Peptoniphilus ovalis]MBU5668430.1 hypothetical protein [Peptoniphilus ovalis]
MLKECIEIFEENKIEDGQNIVIKNYVPKDGKYVLVRMNEAEWTCDEPLVLEYDKKNNKLKGEESLNYNLIKNLDYYSNLLDMNKPLDNKKIIQSSNYYSVFFKESNYPEKMNRDAIKRYFEILKDPYKKYKDKESKNLYKEVEEKLGEVNIEELEKIENWLLKNLDNFEYDLNSKVYYKFFFIYDGENRKEIFDKNIKNYKREQDRYVMVNSFNKNKYNIKIGNTSYGLSNDNMGLNDKKPYLANLVRKVKEPYMITSEEALKQKDFFDYLNSLARKGISRVYFNTENKEIYTSFKDIKYVFIGYELFLYPEKNEAAILNFKHYTKPVPSIDIEFKEFIRENLSRDLSEEEITKQKSKYLKLNDRFEVLKNINWVYFYNYYLKNRDNLEDLNIRDRDLKNILIKYGDNLSRYFLYEDDVNINSLMENLILDSIKYSLSKEYFNKAVGQFNYYLSIKEFLNKESEGEFVNFQDNMREKIRSEEKYNFESDEECLFGIGQVLRYILDQNNMKDKNLSFVKNYLGRNNPKILMRNFEKIVERYAHIIKAYRASNLNQLITNIILYEFQKNKIDDKYIIAGFLDECYIYNKKKEEIKGVENE